MIDLFNIICKFSNPDSRIAAAAELAVHIQGESVLCFQYDKAISNYLPTLGFPQTLNHAKQWQAFLLMASQTPTYSGEIEFEKGEKKQVFTISSGGCIMAIIGFRENIAIVDGMKCVFSLLAALFKSEAKNQDQLGRIRSIEQSSIQSEQLTLHLDKARDQLQDALKTEEEFLSIASHELKTPITSLNAFIEILLETFPAEKDKQTHYFLSRAKLQVKRLITLISELLDVTKIKAGKLELDFSEVGLRALFNELVSDSYSLKSAHKIVMNDIPDITVWCDRNRIEQVISNLLTNAVKYSPGADTIVLNVNEEKENIHVEIQDFGIGIAEKNKAKVFDKFFREHTGDNGMLSSLGLGLYICADIVKRHRGNIWVDSNINKGTTFHFTLPKTLARLN